MEHKHKPPALKSVLFEHELVWQQFMAQVVSVYNDFKDRVISPTNEMLRSHGCPGLTLSVNDNDIFKYLDMEGFNVLLFGEVKSGKTTLLKALIDPNLPLPADSLPCTSILCTIKYGFKKMVKVVHRTDATKTFELDLENVLNIDTLLEPYIVQTDDKRHLPSEWQSIELFWPCELLKSGLTFVDSPGFGENKANDDLLLQAVDKAHLILAVLKPEINLDVKARLSQLDNRNKEMFFVMTKLDTIKPTRRTVTLQEHQEKHISTLKKRIEEELPNYAHKLDHRNFHAVAPQEIVDVEDQPPKYEDRFRWLEKCINEQISAQIQVKAANSVLRNLWNALDQTHVSLQAMLIENTKSSEQCTLDKAERIRQMRAIETEYKRMKEETERIACNTEDEVCQFVKLLLKPTTEEPIDIVKIARQIVVDFHESWKKNHAWTDTEEQLKQYGDDMQKTVIQKYTEEVVKYWRRQEATIQKILSENGRKAAKAAETLKQLLISLNEYITKDVRDQNNQKNTGKLSAKVNANVSAEKGGFGFFEAVSTGGLLGGVLGGGAGAVVGFFGVATVGAAALFGAVPMAVLLIGLFVHDWYAHRSVDEATRLMREKMKTELEMAIETNSSDWIEHYRKFTSRAINKYVTRLEYAARQEIDMYKAQIANLEIELPKIEELVNHLNETISIFEALCSRAQDLMEDNPFHLENMDTKNCTP